MNEENKKTAIQLVKMAAYLLSNPELPNASITTCLNRIDFYSLAITPGEAIRKYGAMEKVVGGNHPTLFILRKQMDGFTVEFNFSRDEVCKKVEKSRKVIPAEPERTLVIPAKEEHEEIEYGWECPDSLLRDNADVLQSAVESLTPKEN